MKLITKKIFNSLHPAFEEDERKIKKIKHGDFCEVEVKVPRNIKFHSKYFALLNTGFEHNDFTQNFEFFRKQVQIVAGYYTLEKTITGEVIKESQSISFSKMDEEKFERLYNDVFDVILKIVGCESEELELEVLRKFS